MNTNFSKRLQAVERVTASAQRAAMITRPIERLSADDQALVLAARAARAGGETAEASPDTTAAMRRYVRACVSYENEREAAGFPMPPFGETIRARVAELRKLRGAA